MLRVKRSVQAQYKYVSLYTLFLGSFSSYLDCNKHLWLHTNWILSTDVNFIASQAVARSKEAKEQSTVVNGTGDAMAALDRDLRAPVGFVAAKSGGVVGGNAGKKTDGAENLAAPANPDAIDIDM